MEKILTNNIRRKLSSKFILHVTLLLSFIVIALILISTKWAEYRVTSELHKRAVLLNKIVKADVTRDFLQSDYKNVDFIVTSIKDFDPDIRRIEFYDQDLMITNSTESGRRLGQGDDPVVIKARQELREVQFKDYDELRFAFPLIIGQTIRGYLLFSYDLSSMHSQIRTLRISGISILLLTIATGVFFAISLARSITAPIKELHRAANEVISGNYQYRINMETDDETMIISQAFNEVTATLSEKIVELSEYAETLARTNRELDRKIQELKSLQELGKVISSIFNLEELLRAIVQNATMVMKSHRCSVVLVDSRSGEYFIKVGKGISEQLDVVENIRLKTGGAVTDYCVQHREPVLVTDLREDDRFPELTRDGKYRTQSFITVPLVVNDRAIGVISITEKMTGEAYTQSDLHLLTIFANQVVIAIENARLYERLVERERIEKELEIAHTIQMNMLPKDYPELEGIAISGIAVPAKEVGGDYYDFLPVSARCVGVVIGDVAGKGVPAALMMVMIRSILRARIMANSNPQIIVSELNTHILSESDPRMFVTLFYAVIDAASREMLYTNAGHNYPLVFHEEDDDFESLEDGGLLMGMFEEATYHQGKVQLKKGDVVVFYTDGIVEAMNERDEMYGFDRLRDLVLHHKHEDADQIRDVILADARQFMGISPQYDDMTLIVVKVNS